jgi:hypothetical protein
VLGLGPAGGVWADTVVPTTTVHNIAMTTPVLAIRRPVARNFMVPQTSSRAGMQTLSHDAEAR